MVNSVEAQGKVWYAHPNSGKRRFLSQFFSAGLLLLLFTLFFSCEKSEVIVYQGGMGWDPPNYGDTPIPVWWNGSDTPIRLPMLTYAGDCPPAGSVEAMTLVNGEPVMVGISSICLEGDQNMKPVMWIGGTVTQLAFPESDHVLGTALDIAAIGEVLYIVGATGVYAPVPLLWVDGYPIEIPLPDDYDAGEALRIVINGNDIYISAIISRGAGESAEFAAGYWKANTNLSDIEWVYLNVPEEEDMRINPPLPMTAAGQDIYAAFDTFINVPQESKPALSKNGGTPTPVIDFNYASEPYGTVYDLAWDGADILATGFIRVEEQYGYPGPVFWKGKDDVKLSTADASLGLGNAYGIELYEKDIYISGATEKKDKNDDNMLISVPAYWINGVRHDRQGLPTSGTVNPGTSDFGQWPEWNSPGRILYWANYPEETSIDSESAVAQAIAVVKK